MDPFPPTEQQRRIIEHRGANLLVFAGPGTGKTETLARRFASLVGDGVAPNQILVLTFSRRAADEMRDRVLLRLRQLRKSGLAVSELFVKTFHSFCGRLLDGDEVRQRRHELLTPVKERLLWRRVIGSGAIAFESIGPDVAASPAFATDCLNIIGQLKGQGVDPSRLAQLAGGDARLRDVAAVFSAMENERLRLGLRDYRDLVNEAVRALRDPASAAAGWLHSADFRHILVDEFQDSDLMQLRLLESLREVMAPAPLFCFVGDVNQSIYRFRGASPGNVETARAIFACETLPLRDNRRSAQAILDVANADPKLDEKSKTSAADPNKQGSVRLVRPRTVEDEILFARDSIAAKVAQDTAPRDIAVLLRQTRPYQEMIIEALREANIPVAALPTAGFHEDAVIDGVLTALRLLAAPADESLWRRLLTNPIVGFRPIDVRLAFDVGHRDKVNDLRTRLSVGDPSGVKPIKEFLGAWARCAAAYGTSSPHELVQTIVYELDLLRPMREDAPVAGFDVAASPVRLQALLDAAGDYSDFGTIGAAIGAPPQDALEFIERLDETIGLLADANQPPPGLLDGVRVMSIHASKGLEFDFVVIPQLIDGILPADERANRLLGERSQHSLAKGGIAVFVEDDEQRQEEHSLWYVALTRAKSDVLTSAALLDDDAIDLQLSRFAKGIEEEAAGEARVNSRHYINEDAREARVNSRHYIDEDAGEARVNSRHYIARDIKSRDDIKIHLAIEGLSPTSIGTFVTCPRRFFYGDVLRLPKRDDDVTHFGVVLHRVLARFHELETNFESVSDPATSAARYRGILAEIVAEEAGAQTGPLAQFEREYLENRLGQYAFRLAEEASESPFSVLACERSVTSSFAGVTLRGKADRIDRLTGGGLVVRDYKSGRMHGALAQVLRNVFARLDAGEIIFGDISDALNLQTILYIPGVQQAYGEPVTRLDYLYFRGTDFNDGKLFVDSTPVGQSDSTGLSREEVARVERDIAAKIVAWCSSGEMTAFPTARDERTCLFCTFTRVCPGAGSIAL